MVKAGSICLLCINIKALKGKSICPASTIVSRDRDAAALVALDEQLEQHRGFGLVAAGVAEVPGTLEDPLPRRRTRTPRPTYCTATQRLLETPANFCSTFPLERSTRTAALRFSTVTKAWRPPSIRARPLSLAGLGTASLTSPR